MLKDLADRFLLALQYKDYRTLWIANVCAGSAAWALIVARGWLVYVMTDSSGWASNFHGYDSSFFRDSGHRFLGGQIR